MKAGVSGGMHSFIAAETGPGPEGSRLTVDEWRLKGCRAESGFVRMSRYVLPTLNMFHLVLMQVFLIILELFGSVKIQAASLISAI